MDNIEISKYFELTDEDKIYVNRYVLSLLDIEMDKIIQKLSQRKMQLKS